MSFIIYPAAPTGVAIYINGGLFPRIPKIFEKINSILPSCFENSKMSNDFSPNNVLVLYLDTENEINQGKLLNLYNENKERAFDIVNININNIRGFLRLELYDITKHVEIYDVCIEENFRNKKITSILLKNVIEVTPEKYRKFWLGIKWLFNPFRDIALKSYLKNGFRVKNLTGETFSGRPIPFPVIGMLNNRDVNVEIIPIYESLNYLDNLICNLKLYLDWGQAVILQKKYIRESKEFAGSMDLVKIGRKKYSLSLNYNSITEGQEFTVKFPESPINWHSHPYICYQKLKCYIGWPSSKDMKETYTGYYTYGLLGHFIFTVEGLYFIKLTSEMMKFMQIISVNQNWVDAFGNLILIRFAYLEKYRLISETDIERINCLYKTGENINCLLYNNENREENIQKFLDRANNFGILEYTLNKTDETKFLEFGEILNFPILEINKNVKEALEYYENFTKLAAEFSVFEALFIRGDNEIPVIKINLSTILAPKKEFCPS